MASNNINQWMITQAPKGYEIYTIAESLTGKSCGFFHRWGLVRDTGASKYFKCSKCDSRRVKQSQQVYQPIDWEWMRHERPTINEPSGETS